MPKKPPLPHCGLCQIKVKDWKIHEAGALHRKNLERAADGEFGTASGAVANKQLAGGALDRMDEAFNEMKKGLSGEETAEISRKGMERDKKREAKDGE